jgi:hypothetical protein
LSSIVDCLAKSYYVGSTTLSIICYNVYVSIYICVFVCMYVYVCMFLKCKFARTSAVEFRFAWQTHEEKKTTL